MASERDMLGLDGSAALVTGAGAGLGKATALRLAEAGCRVAVADADGDAAQATADAIAQQGGEAVALQASVVDRDQVWAMVEQARDALGPLSVAVNVVGGLGGLRAKPLLDLTLEEWRIPVELNLTSTMLCLQAEAVSMIRDEQRGRIVNFGSSSGVTASATLAHYGAANAAVMHLTKSAAVELAPFGLRVNCIVPGTHWTERIRGIYEDPDGAADFKTFWDRAMKATPLGRLGNPDEAAAVALFLASDLSSYMTGHSVISDGGITHTTARGFIGSSARPQALAG